MNKEEKLIDEIDLALFRVLCNAGYLKKTPANVELIKAIGAARTLSYALLPESKRRLFEEPVTRLEGAK